MNKDSGSLRLYFPGLGPNSFDKYLNKMILSDHCHFIRRFSGLYKTRQEKDFPEICPYAYAYVFWNEAFYNINPFYNEVAPRKKRGLKSIELPFFFNNECIKETIYYITKNYNEINISTLIWIVRHMVWIVAKNHFFEWIILAKENAAKSIRPVTKYDNFNSSDLFSFVINENDSIVEFHVSSSVNENIR
ncbi:hypothetical protein HQN89_31420 [Paenibacillus frigoriresistens]|uniref:hypothetical protein n=1 Tax=Paenibacillus alginolyticus TaxID=59839 RepID=UPI001566F6AF|nr:hypothetical protein [Paenibacillus frigoriresistens]NRF95387.1 hypothetical protein [Paenibacillus frigoriresistens]